MNDFDGLTLEQLAQAIRDIRKLNAEQKARIKRLEEALKHVRAAEAAVSANRPDEPLSP